MIIYELFDSYFNLRKNTTLYSKKQLLGFKKDFAENDIWKHFRAVKEGKVYDLDYKKFGMSAKFNYKEALNDLDKLFYGKGSNEVGNAGDKTNEEK